VAAADGEAVAARSAKAAATAESVRFPNRWNRPGTAMFTLPRLRGCQMSGDCVDDDAGEDRRSKNADVVSATQIFDRRRLITL